MHREQTILDGGRAVAVVWATGIVLGMLFMGILNAGDPGLQVALAVVLIEWGVTGVAVLVTTSSKAAREVTDSPIAIQQRHSEPRPLYVARTWVTLHPVLARTAITALARTPAAVRRGAQQIFMPAHSNNGETP